MNARQHSPIRFCFLKALAVASVCLLLLMLWNQTHKLALLDAETKASIRLLATFNAEWIERNDGGNAKYCAEVREFASKYPHQRCIQMYVKFLGDEDGLREAQGPIKGAGVVFNHRSVRDFP